MRLACRVLQRFSLPKGRELPLLASGDGEEAGKPWPLAAIPAMSLTGGGQLAGLVPRLDQALEQDRINVA